LRAKTGDDEGDDEGQMVERLSLIICLFYPVKGVIDISSVGWRWGAIVGRQRGFIKDGRD
jgi:hypothetical protein